MSSFTLTESYAPHPLESLIGQAWSLKVELAFYLLVPLVFVVVWWAAGRFAGRGTAGTAVASSTASRCSALWSASRTAEVAAGSVTAQRSLAWALIPFMSGLALAAVLAGREPRWTDRRRAAQDRARRRSRPAWRSRSSPGASARRRPGSRTCSRRSR